MNQEIGIHLETLIVRYPQLSVCREDLEAAYRILEASFGSGGTLLVCGNGGSASDAAHITGELMKGFLLQRPLPEGIRSRLLDVDAETGARLARELQGALPVIPLTTVSSVITAYANDCNPDFIFAQQVVGYGKKGGTLLCISTSGNARNVIAAAVTARAMGLSVIGLTGSSGGRLLGRSDVCIRVPETDTFKVQELHLPVYHVLCAMLETRFFAHGEEGTE